MVAMGTAGFRISMVALLAAAALLAGCETTREVEPAPARMAPGDLLFEKLRAATVEVFVDGRLEGSGWHADGEGLIVTGAHVVWDRGRTLEVRSPAAGRRLARIVAVDRGHDLVLLSIEKGEAAYPYLEVAPVTPAPGETVYLLGAVMFRHALMLRGTVARSSVSYEWFSAQKKYVGGYYLTGPSPMGTSGGGWVDGRGRVVGNQAAFINHNGASVSVAFAATAEAVRDLLASRRTVTTATAGLAIEELWERPVGFIGRFPRGAQGVVPAAIVPGGPAEAAGLGLELIITAVDDTPVVYRDDFLRAIRAHKPGDKVTLTILDAEATEPRQVVLTLGRL
jgi:S1-C subfamily serine protease